ncbi:hypothetical protein NP493_659g01065 [Ridgeia piscesae]|uniref:Uncharacterized protein n=1 Tax=Ridgeia piscesae TaxID=27915 RepID=A0AAD9KSG5_RIDPI|nr:hypothetical protein NP493_659g01065 [Ridgeia piscesae]
MTGGVGGRGIGGGDGWGATGEDGTLVLRRGGSGVARSAAGVRLLPRGGRGGDVRLSSSAAGDRARGSQRGGRAGETDGGRRDERLWHHARRQGGGGGRGAARWQGRRGRHARRHCTDDDGASVSGAVHTHLLVGVVPL